MGLWPLRQQHEQIWTRLNKQNPWKSLGKTLGRLWNSSPPTRLHEVCPQPTWVAHPQRKWTIWPSRQRWCLWARADGLKSRYFAELFKKSIPHRIHVCEINGNIYHQYTPNVSIYTIHGSYGYGLAASNEIQVAMSVVMVGLPCTSTDLGNGQIDSEWQRLVDQVLLQPFNPWINGLV